MADAVLERIAAARVRINTTALGDGEAISDEVWLAAGLSSEDLAELRSRQQTFHSYEGPQHEMWRALNAN